MTSITAPYFDLNLFIIQILGCAMIPFEAKKILILPDFITMYCNPSKIMLHCQMTLQVPRGRNTSVTLKQQSPKDAHYHKELGRSNSESKPNQAHHYR